MTSLSRSIALALALVAASCTSVPLTSLVSLARIDPRSTDLGQLRVAVRLPDALKPRPGGVKLDAVVKRPGAPDQTTSYALAPVDDPVERAAVPDDGESGSVHVFRMMSADVLRLSELRNRLYAEVDAGGEATLGLGIATKEFCRLGELSDGALPVTTYLATSETQGFVTVTRDIDLRSQPETAEHVKTLQACP
ncbi:hypothetical protein [Oryzibacter oryziterrae]|uniref:hypothetical protein n=1 Tax=Oryzibacter oryziterrae TaxID=2766474 RepID=UPI001F2DB109|nr:hypothetical protein [Oryzibacter oryziterrae]